MLILRLSCEPLFQWQFKAAFDILKCQFCVRDLINNKWAGLVQPKIKNL